MNYAHRIQGTIMEIIRPTHNLQHAAQSKLNDLGARRNQWAFLNDEKALETEAPVKEEVGESLDETNQFKDTENKGEAQC